MDKKMKGEFIQMLRDEMGTETGWAVIMSMVGMVEDDDRFNELADIYKGKHEYGQFLTEKEAKKAADGLVGYDGNRGPKWPMPQQLFEKVESLGGRKSEHGKYNGWALFAVMNMMHSDYGGVISTVAHGDEYAKMCYMLAVAWLTDADKRNDVRKHFGFE